MKEIKYCQIGCFDGTNLVRFIQRAKANGWRVEASVLIGGILLNAYTDEAAWVHGIMMRESKDRLLWPSFMMPWKNTVDKKLERKRQIAIKALSEASRIADSETQKLVRTIESRIKINKYSGSPFIVVEDYDKQKVKPTKAG